MATAVQYTDTKEWHIPCNKCGCENVYPKKPTGTRLCQGGCGAKLVIGGYEVINIPA